MKKFYFLSVSLLVVLPLMGFSHKRSFSKKASSSKKTTIVAPSRPAVSVRDAQSNLPQGQTSGKVINTGNSAPLTGQEIEKRESRSNQQETNQFNQVNDYRVNEKKNFREQSKAAPISTDPNAAEFSRDNQKRSDQDLKDLSYQDYRRSQDKARLNDNRLYSTDQKFNTFQNKQVIKMRDESESYNFDGLTLQDINRYQFRRNRPDNIPVQTAGE